MRNGRRPVRLATTPNVPRRSGPPVSNPSAAGVRISRATPQADLAAVVWPGVSTIYHPRTESAEQLQAVAQHIDQLERRRGLRPREGRVVPLVETPRSAA